MANQKNNNHSFEQQLFRMADKLRKNIDAAEGAAELQNVLELVNDAWNYFPHKIIGGLSPAEKLLEYQNKTKNTHENQ